MTPRLRRRIVLLAVCALLAAIVPDGAALGAPGVPPAGPDEPEPIRWLTEAALAPRGVSYTGTKTVTVWAQTVRASEVRIYHQAPTAHGWSIWPPAINRNAWW